MPDGLNTIMFPIGDLARARAVYRELPAVQPSMDEPYHVGFDGDGQHVGLDPNGHASGMTGPVGYWHVSDITSSLHALLDAGADTVQDITDVGGGKLIATVRDADGNVIGLLEPA